MHVNVADSASHERTFLDESQQLRVRDYRSRREFVHLSEHFDAVRQDSTCNLTDNEWMDEDISRVECELEPVIDSSQVINPDGCVNQDQVGSWRLLGASSNCGAVPPNRANRRAASRSMSATRPARSNALRSLMPVSSSALASSSSSSVTVASATPDSRLARFGFRFCGRVYPTIRSTTPPR